MTQDAPVIRILKLGNCPTLSGKGQLGYHIGCETEGDIFFRIASNSGGGFYSPKFVSLKAIQAILETAPKPLTSYTLSKLFQNQSVNTPGYLWAILLAEGLVQRDEQNPRVYVALSPDSFMAEIDLLVTSGTTLDVPEQVTGKGVVKNKRQVVDPATLTSPRSRGRPKKSNSAAAKS